MARKEYYVIGDYALGECCSMLPCKGMAIHEARDCGGLAAVEPARLLPLTAQDRRRLLRRGWRDCRRCVGCK